MDFIEFRTEVNILGITCHQILVKAHWSIRKIETYHTSICCAYNIIQVETKGIIFKNARLQMICKAINNTIGPDGLVPTLIIFGAYLSIIIDLPLLLS